MSTHRVPRDGHTRGVQLGEGGKERCGEFARDVGFHMVVGGVGRRRGVDVEAGAGAEVPGCVFA